MKNGSLFPDICEKSIVTKKHKKINPFSIISKRFLEEYYIPKYEEFFNIPAKVDWGKDIKLLNNTVKHYKDVTIFNCETLYELMTKVCDIFFTDNSSYVLKNAWSIQSFIYLFQSLLLKLKQKNENCLTPLIDGYKLAYFNHYEEKIESIDESIFSQIYIYIKPLYEKYGKPLNFTLKRFTELYFLVGFDHLGKKKYTVEFFITSMMKKLFDNWLYSKRSLIFYPKDDMVIYKDRVGKEILLNNMEDCLLLHIKNKKEIECKEADRFIHYTYLLEKYNLKDRFNK